MILFHQQKGFTIIELVVSVAIFAFMTAFLVARYGTFNQGVLLTNLAYDVALTIRNAQSYGLNVKSLPAGDDENSCNSNPGELPDSVDVSFVRPNPDSYILSIMPSASSKKNYTEITVAASDGSTKRIAVRSTGQIAVLHQ
jgi:prepilin-type N-terminal cleavage/methylation domain-containing protein